MGLRVHDVIHHGLPCTPKNSPNSHWVKLCNDRAFPNPIWAACRKLFKVLKVTKVSNLGLERKHQNLQQRLANQPKMLHVHPFNSSFTCMFSWFNLFSLHLPSPLFICSPVSHPHPHLAPISFLLHSASISQPHHHLAKKTFQEPALRFLSQEISVQKDLKASVLRPHPVISLQCEKREGCEYFYKKKIMLSFTLEGCWNALDLKINLKEF